jgi:hypothetical protein
MKFGCRPMATPPEQQARQPFAVPRFAFDHPVPVGMQPVTQPVGD